jgi:hypothetical protein
MEWRGWASIFAGRACCVPVEIARRGSCGPDAFADRRLLSAKSMLALPLPLGGWRTLLSEVRSKEFSGAALFAPLAKGAVFDVAPRPSSVLLS